MERNQGTVSPAADPLRLDAQLCFPLYACAREVIKRYKPHLDALDLTYTQYITMMVLWEEREITAKALGQRLRLDSGTLTPLLKKLAAKGWLTRTRGVDDERNLIVTLTPAGAALKAQAAAVPAAISQCLPLTAAEAVTLYQLLYKLLDALD